MHRTCACVPHAIAAVTGASVVVVRSEAPPFTLVELQSAQLFVPAGPPIQTRSLWTTCLPNSSVLIEVSSASSPLLPEPCGEQWIRISKQARPWPADDFSWCTIYQSQIHRLLQSIFCFLHSWMQSISLVGNQHWDYFKINVPVNPAALALVAHCKSEMSFQKFFR